MLRKKIFNEQKAKTKIFKEARKVNKIIGTGKVIDYFFLTCTGSPAAGPPVLTRRVKAGFDTSHLVLSPFVQTRSR